MPSKTAKLKWRHTHHYVSGDSVEVGDVPGHVLGAIKGSGLAFFDNGDIATHTIAILHDFTNGSGPHTFYVTYAFEDGSTLNLSAQGESQGESGGSIRLDGTGKLVSGGGRFAGASGSCTYSGRRLLASGVPEIYLDFAGECSC